MIKKLSLMLFFVILTQFISNFSFAFELTNEQIFTAKNNGMITVICLLTDILTGSFARGIFALSIIILGWLFLIGEIKDYKPVFFIVLSISITLGATNIANFFTGNDYSCAKFNQVISEQEKDINNLGTCIISELRDYYYPSQVWKVCDKENVPSTCNRTVDNQTAIISNGKNSIVTLYSCQDGYFKDSVDSYLFFKCEEVNKVDVFRNLFDSSTANSGICKKACTHKDLLNISYRYKINTGSFKQIENSGRKESNGKYYTQGYKLSANCLDGYIEYDINDEPNKDGLKITCGTNATFNIEGSCKSTCSLSSISLNRKVSTWKKCKDDKCTLTDETNFLFGDVLEIDTCKPGYSLSSKSNNTARIKCGNGGSWVFVNNNNADGSVIGNQCIKKCSFESIRNYNFSEIKFNQNLITSGDFEDGDELLIDGCNNGHFIDYMKEKGVLTCNSEGTWDLEDGTSYCNKPCSTSDLLYFKNSETYNYCDYKGESCFNFLKSSEDILSGYLLKIVSCEDGFSYNSGYNSVTAFCDNGVLKYNNNGNYCMPNCDNSILFTSFNNVISWKEVKSNGDDLKGIVDTITVDSDIFLKNNSYYSIRSCATGYSLPNDKSVILRCYDSKWKLHSGRDNYCMKSCNNSDLFNNVTNVTSFYQSNSFGNVLNDGEHIDDPSGVTKPGLYYIINECAEGYKIYNNKSVVFRCLDGKWSTYSNSKNVCVRDE